MMTGTSGRAALAFGSSSRPLMPGMLMSDRIRIRGAPPGVGDALQRRDGRLRELHHEAPGAEVAAELLAKQQLDVRLVVDHQDEQAHCLTSSSRERGRRARQHDPEFGELAGLGVDLDRAGMLLHDDVVAEREAEAGPFAGGLGREERIEHLRLHLGRDAGAVVANPDLDAVAEVPASPRQGSARTAPFARSLRFAVA